MVQIINTGILLSFSLGRQKDKPILVYRDEAMSIHVKYLLFCFIVFILETARVANVEAYAHGDSPGQESIMAESEEEQTSSEFEEESSLLLWELWDYNYGQDNDPEMDEGGKKESETDEKSDSYGEGISKESCILDLAIEIDIGGMHMTPVSGRYLFEYKNLFHLNGHDQRNNLISLNNQYVSNN
jgi:hypothetical protein